MNEIILGDAYKLIKEIPDKSIDCVYTDIPYLIMAGGCAGTELAKRIRNIQHNALKDINKGIDYSILDEFVRVCKKINIFIWCSKLQIIDILDYFNKIPDVTFEILVWCKTNPTPATNHTWLPDIEYCLYFRQKGVQLNDGYDHKSKWYISPINKVDKDDYNHPTIKPLELVKRHLLHTTQKGQVVLDAFAGSGTTCEAAKLIGRNYLGFEINEEYHKIAVERLNGINQKGEMNLFETDFDKLEQMNLFEKEN